MINSYRRRAEAILAARRECPDDPEVGKELKALLHDMQVRQLELEMQNEELLRAQRDLTKSQNWYEELYDFAPVGYLMLNLEGQIVDGNHTSASLLELERSALAGRTFSEFVQPDSEAAWRRHRRAVLESDAEHSTELSLSGAKGTPFSAWLQCSPRAGSTPGDWRCMMVLVDITDKKRAEEALRRANEEMQHLVQERTVELHESEEKYRRLAESTLDVLYSVDRKGVFTYIGPQVNRYGYRASSLVGRPFLDILLPEDRPPLAEAFERTLQRGRSSPLEFRFRAPDGHTYWFEERSTVQTGQNGEIQGITGVLRDITERKDFERRERIALNRLQAFEECVNQGPAVIIRWRIEPDEWPIEMVSANIRQLGYEAEDLISGRIAWKSLTHPADDLRLEKEMKGILARGQREFHQAYRLITKAGYIREVEDWNTVIVNDEGDPTHIQGVLLDVTEQAKLEQRRVESEERYRKLFEGESDAILVMDAETRMFVDVNDAALALYGYSRDEFLGLRHVDISAEPGTAERMVQKTMEGAAGGTVMARWHRKKDGTVFPVEISPSKFTLEGRTVLCGMVRDITERRKAERALLAKQTRLRRLAARLESARDEEQRSIAEGLHDDVAQLLTAATVKLTVARGFDPGDEAEESFRHVEALLTEAHEKIRSLSFELFSSTLERLGLREAIKELCEAIRDRYGVAFEISGDGDPNQLDHDSATVVFKSLRELLFNVVKHADTQVGSIRMESRDDMLLLEVEDRGKGAYRLENRMESGAGRGLGLFGIRERLLDVGGHMKVESKPGDYTRVTLKIPVQQGKKRKNTGKPRKAGVAR